MGINAWLSNNLCAELRSTLIYLLKPRNCQFDEEIELEIVKIPSCVWRGRRERESMT